MKKLDKLRDFFYEKKMGNLMVFLFILAFIFFIIFLIKKYGTPPSNSRFSLGSSTESEGDKDCSVVGINMHGMIVTYIPEHAEGDPNFNYDVTSSEKVTSLIDQANKDSDIKAIVVEVDSNGGYPVAGEEMANAIKNSEKPIVGFIRETGASAAYWAISGADKIFASKNSNVGSIGVTQSYLTNLKKNNKDGYEYQQLSIGKFKDAGSADKPLTQEEKKIFTRDLNIIYQNFIEAVSKNRNIPIEEVEKFADGSTVLGEKAKELGMIDEIGGLLEVEKYLEGVIGEKPEICWE